MATATIKKNEFRGPFFGDQLSYIKGLDQLGLQNTSESTYTQMLPGITNVTNRIRFYGFYCWLLDKYAKVDGSANRQHQYNFIRRAELLIALVMQVESPDVTQIPGSSFARQMIDSSIGGNFYDLSEGADVIPGVNKKTYWKSPMGALGQYYLGSMRNMGLIVARQDDPHMYVRTSKDVVKVSGIELAEAFAVSIPDEVQELFLRSVKAGKLWAKDTKQLNDCFNLVKIPEDGLEQSFYLELLLGKDYPLHLDDVQSYNRKQTLVLLLQFLRVNPSQNCYGLFHDLYQASATLEPTDSTRFGWYFYQLNEYWQYACNTLLWSVLHLVDKSYNGQAYVPDLLSDLSQSIADGVKAVNAGIGVESKVNLLLDRDSLPLDDEDDYIQNINSFIKAKEPIEGATVAILLIVKLYHKNWEMLERLKVFGRKYGTLRSGNFIQYMELLHAKGDMPIGKFLQEFVYRNIINRHQFTALRKMGSGRQSSQKFFLEDMVISFNEITFPQFSLPRLQTLHTVGQDLHLITRDNHITELGLTLIEQQHGTNKADNT